MKSHVQLKISNWNMMTHPEEAKPSLARFSLGPEPALGVLEVY